MIKVACKRCGASLEFPEQFAGKKVMCTQCMYEITVPPQVVDDTVIIKFHCPNCDQKIGVNSQYAGKKIRCAKCKNPIRIPYPEEYSTPVKQDEIKKTVAAVFSEKMDVGFGNTQVKPKYSGGGSVFRYVGYGLSGLSVVLILLIGWVIYLAAGDVRDFEDQSVSGTKPLEAVAQQFVGSMFARDVNDVNQMFSGQSQLMLQEGQLEKFAEKMGQSGQLEFGEAYNKKRDGKELMISRSSLKAGRQSQCMTFLFVEDVNGVAIDSVLISKVFGARGFAVGSYSYNVIQAMEREEVRNVATAVTQYTSIITLIVLGLIAIQVVCLWLIFERAEQKGWAALIPIYNICVLANIADKPSWLGLFPPFYFVIFISLAKNFGRNTLFGIGLFLLPIIFMPILAFDV